MTEREEYKLRLFAFRVAWEDTYKTETDFNMRFVKALLFSARRLTDAQMALAEGWRERLGKRRARA